MTSRPCPPSAFQPGARPVHLICFSHGPPPAAGLSVLETEEVRMALRKLVVAVILVALSGCCCRRRPAVVPAAEVPPCGPTPAVAPQSPELPPAPVPAQPVPAGPVSQRSTRVAEGPY